MFSGLLNFGRFCNSSLFFAQGSNSRSVLVMLGQKKISAFFKPSQRNNLCTSLSGKESDLDLLEGETPAKKKQRIDSEPAEQENVLLSPGQQQKMVNNKLAAKIKLTETNTQGLVTNIGRSWYKALETEFSKDYFKKLSTFVNTERQKHTIYPPSDQVFAWTQMSDIKEVKVVILGQDPYHGPNQAHGLCFSVQNGVPPPPSLVNMYKELENDIEGFKRPPHGYLTGWAKQGVLLLNACLTVRAHQANSHKDQGWENLTDAVIRWLNSNLTGVVFLLWGAYAQKKGAFIDKKKHHVLTAVHPSPLSAHRGFFGCKHFSKTNELLKKQGDPIIDWTKLPLS